MVSPGSIAEPERRFEWKMVTAWPKNFPGLGTSANDLAARIETMSGGRISIKVYGAGELVAPFEVFDTVSRGTAEMGHSISYYWKGKSEAAQLLATIPFGLTAPEKNAWLYFGGGLELWRELYAPFGLIPFPAGNTGVQMAGWFNREINSVADLKGLKIRMPGLGGEVLARAGATTITLPGGELFTALQSGTIDATEWIGPANDLAFGLHNAARYYYYPGWQEPGPTPELIINQAAWESLPPDLQAIVETATKATSLEMLANFTARNPQALKTLVEEHGVELRALPDDVLEELRRFTAEVMQELTERDPMAARIYQSISEFREQSANWQAISAKAYLQTRDQ
ncbi:MAG: TRAP transporter substrate-binding protein [Gammaproteobacteria bacterium]|nr:TRAP transporter substrate-binding protein [Gammaproteobacteria bacterium]